MTEYAIRRSKTGMEMLLWNRIKKQEEEVKQNTKDILVSKKDEDKKESSE